MALRPREGSRVRLPLLQAADSWKELKFQRKAEPVGDSWLSDFGEITYPPRGGRLICETQIAHLPHLPQGAGRTCRPDARRRPRHVTWSSRTARFRLLSLSEQPRCGFLPFGCIFSLFPNTVSNTPLMRSDPVPRSGSQVHEETNKRTASDPKRLMGKRDAVRGARCHSPATRSQSGRLVEPRRSHGTREPTEGRGRPPHPRCAFLPSALCYPYSRNSSSRQPQLQVRKQTVSTCVTVLPRRTPLHGGNLG